jgi:hypothetical protein
MPPFETHFINKKNLREAILSKVRKRNVMLFAFYRPYIISAYSSRYVAHKISTDLGITISTKIIERIRTQKKRMTILAATLMVEYKVEPKVINPVPSSSANESHFKTDFSFSDPNQTDEHHIKTNLKFL